MLYKSIIRAAGIAAMFAVMFVGGAFAQRVGDVVQFQGQSYRVEESRNGRVVLQEVRGPSGGGGDRYDGGNKHGRGGKRYEAVDELLTWAQADSEAKRRGGHLAVITSEGEQREVESVLTKGKGYWIGGYREKDDINYQWVNGGWVTGERSRYTNWGSGYPKRGNFTRIHLGAQTFGKWFDDYPNGKRGYVLEWDR